MAEKAGKRAKGRGGRSHASRRPLVIGVGAGLLIVACALLVVLMNREPAVGYYRHSTPSEVRALIDSGEPVIVYFHSPT